MKGQMHDATGCFEMMDVGNGRYNFDNCVDGTVD